MVKILRENNELKEIPVDCVSEVTLLSKEEAETLLTQEQRKCKGTQEAIDKGLNVHGGGYSIYWLRTAKSYNSVYCVDSTGYIREGKIYSKVIGDRPVLHLVTSGLTVGDKAKFGDYTFTIISDKLALCDVVIGCGVFNEGGGGSNFDISKVKNRLYAWFNGSEYEEDINTQPSEDFTSDESDEYSEADIDRIMSECLRKTFPIFVTQVLKNLMYNREDFYQLSFDADLEKYGFSKALIWLVLYCDMDESWYDECTWEDVLGRDGTYDFIEYLEDNFDNHDIAEMIENKAYQDVDAHQDEYIEIIRDIYKNLTEEQRYQNADIFGAVGISDRKKQDAIDNQNGMRSDTDIEKEYDYGF